MKKRLLLILESCAFVALVLAVLAGLTNLMERKVSRNQFGPFLENPKQYDVLFFGDSRFVNCMFPMEMWTETGVAGYNLSCYGNTMPITYWSMINALDYAKPKVVTIATNGVRNDLKVTGSSSDAHTAFDFFPLTRNKIRAIEDLMSDPKDVDDDGNRYADMKWEYYFTLGKYHSRWNELTPGDWKGGEPSVQNGAEMVVGVTTTEDYTIIGEDEYAEESGVGYAYLRMAIEECQRRGIEVLLVNLPYPASENSQMHANTVRSVAQEYGVRYVDFVQLDSVADYATDCYDAQAHLNPSGARKVTAYLGRYLRDHYGLADRRGAAGYEGWEALADAYVDHKLDLIRGADKLNDLLMLLHDDDFDVRVALAPDSPVYFDDQAILLMHNIAREHVLEANEYEAWSNAMYPLEAFDAAIWDNAPYLLTMTDGSYAELSGEAAQAAVQAAFGEAAGAAVQVIDRRTGEIAVEKTF